MFTKANVSSVISMKYTKEPGIHYAINAVQINAYIAAIFHRTIKTTVQAKMQFAEIIQDKNIMQTHVKD